jgi:hypothetical protein
MASPRAKTIFKRGFWLIWIIAALVGGYYAITSNPVLGRWAELPQVGFPTNRKLTSYQSRGVEFYRTRSFVTFGMGIEGRPIDYYGKYSFSGTNLIKLETKGFRTVLNGKQIDQSITGPRAALAMPAIWHLSADGKMLEEQDNFGEGGQRTFYREKK